MASVFDFESVPAYLKGLRENYPGRKRPIPVAQWARILGFRNRRSLEYILAGKRLPSQQLVLELARAMGWAPREQLYFELLVEKGRLALRGRSTAAVDAKLKEIRPAPITRRIIQSEVFAYIAHWYHLVLKQLVTTPAFREDPEWIRKRLRGKVSQSEIRAAIETMIRLGILERDRVTGKIFLRERGALYTGEDIPSKAVRSHHRQMLKRAEEAIDEQSVSEREYIGITFRGSSEKMQAMKKRLREIRDELNADFEDPQGDQVFQLQLLLFEHTRRS